MKNFMKLLIFIIILVVYIIIIISNINNNSNIKGNSILINIFNKIITNSKINYKIFNTWKKIRIKNSKTMINNKFINSIKSKMNVLSNNNNNNNFHLKMMKMTSNNRNLKTIKIILYQWIIQLYNKYEINNKPWWIINNRKL